MVPYLTDKTAYFCSIVIYIVHKSVDFVNSFKCFDSERKTRCKWKSIVQNNDDCGIAHATIPISEIPKGFLCFGAKEPIESC